MIDPQSTSTRRLFSDWLAEHRYGVADIDLADALRDVVDACARTQKPGSLTFSISITPGGESMTVIDKVTTKLPVVPDPKIYFVDLDGNLTKHSPIQPPLFRADRIDDTPPDSISVRFPSSRVLPAGVDPATGEIADPDDNPSA